MFHVNLYHTFAGVMAIHRLQRLLTRFLLFIINDHHTIVNGICVASRASNGSQFTRLSIGLKNEFARSFPSAPNVQNTLLTILGSFDFIV
jgi:hypothetical protein